MAGPYTTDDLAQYVGLAAEVTPGTGLAPTLFLPYAGDVANEHNMDGDDIWEGGTGPYPARAVKTKQRPHGSFVIPWKPTTGAKVLAWFLGNDASVAAGSLFDHTAKPAQDVRYLTVEWNAAGASDLTERFAGCVLNKLTIEAPEANGELTLAVDWQGRTPTVVTAASPTYETGMHASTPGAGYRPSDCAFTLNNVAATNIVSWKLELDWGVDDDIFTSTWLRAAFTKLKLTATLTVRILELNVADYRQVNYGAAAGSASVADFFDGPASAWAVTLSNGLASTNLRQATLTCPQVQWKNAPRKITSQGSTSILELTGIVRKPAADLLTVVSRTADTAAY